MASPLTVHNAEIKTATVEIRTLAISGKQVTLAVFRQLREEELIAEDGTLNGVPWGTVNYHPDKCGGDNWPDHWHVVWQRGSELLRAHVDQSAEFDRKNLSFSPDSGDAFYDAVVREALHGTPHPGYFKGQPVVTESDYYLQSRKTAAKGRWIAEHGIRSFLEMSEDTYSVAKEAVELATARSEAAEEQEQYPDETGDSWKTRKRRGLPEVEAAFAAAVSGLGDPTPDGPTVDDLFRIYRTEMHAEALRRQRHRDQRAAIGDLPQLFIAV